MVCRAQRTVLRKTDAATHTPGATSSRFYGVRWKGYRSRIQTKNTPSVVCFFPFTTLNTLTVECCWMDSGWIERVRDDDVLAVNQRLVIHVSVCETLPRSVDYSWDKSFSRHLGHDASDRWVLAVAVSDRCDISPYIPLWRLNGPIGPWRPCIVYNSKCILIVMSPLSFVVLIEFCP